MVTRGSEFIVFVLKVKVKVSRDRPRWPKVLRVD